jgi:tetratricopeptide (TPR) repeat protein
VKPSPLIKRGAPLTHWASRIVFACVLLATPLYADGPETPAEPDWLAKSRVALVKGEDEATVYAARALKKSPEFAPENRQMALVLFWSGHFEDSARHMRRALAADPNALIEQPKLGDLMPPADAKDRLNQLAPDAEKDPELCFLAGSLLLLDQDRARALAFLVRAEELAGTDGQAATLVDDQAQDRNRLRGETALQEGDWEDAVRSFTFAALDAPTVPELYAGLVIALAAQGEDAMALQLSANVFERYQRDSTLPWLQALKPKGRAAADAAMRLQTVENASIDQLRLAATLFFTAGWYRSSRDAGVRLLLVDKLDDFTHDLQGWMEKHQLTQDPAGDDPDTPPADTPDDPVEPEKELPTLDTARKLIRRGEFTEAYKILDLFVNEQAVPEVYHLLFVVLIGRGELQDSATALQTWFLKVDDEQRTKLNSLRELFSTKELFEGWRNHILLVRDADANAGLPRLLNCYVEITRGRYDSARDELVVAKIESPANQMVLALERILESDDFLKDRTPDGIQDDPTPKSLMARADREFRAGDYQGALSTNLAAAEADPKLPYITAALLRCYFALADYDNAAAQLKLMLNEQKMSEREPREFQLPLEAGYDNIDTFRGHLEALKAECETRDINARRWMLYGVILLTRNDFNGARDALKEWHDLDTSKTRDPVMVKFYEYARKRAS